jgi:hypothetical protein
MTKRRQNKLTSLANAIREIVHDGDWVALALCSERDRNTSPERSRTRTDPAV